jgi:hypothetical protein
MLRGVKPRAANARLVAVDVELQRSRTGDRVAPASAFMLTLRARNLPTTR